MSQLSRCQSFQETPEEQDRAKVASGSQVKTFNNLACTLHTVSFSLFRKIRKKKEMKIFRNWMSYQNKTKHWRQVCDIFTRQRFQLLKKLNAEKDISM